MTTITITKGPGASQDGQVFNRQKKKTVGGNQFWAATVPQVWGTVSSDNHYEIEVRILADNDTGKVALDWTRPDVQYCDGGIIFFEPPEDVIVGGWYKWDIRLLNPKTGAVVETVSQVGNSWGVGLVYITCGQSNMGAFNYDLQTPPTPSLYLGVHAREPHKSPEGWYSPTFSAFGDGLITFMNNIQGAAANTAELGLSNPTTTNIPVGVVATSISGLSITPREAQLFGISWNENRGDIARQIISALSGQLYAEALLWEQGENFDELVSWFPASGTIDDSRFGSGSEYATSLKAVIRDFRDNIKSPDLGDGTELPAILFSLPNQFTCYGAIKGSTVNDSLLGMSHLVSGAVGQVAREISRACSFSLAALVPDTTAWTPSGSDKIFDGNYGLHIKGIEAKRWGQRASSAAAAYSSLTTSFGQRKGGPQLHSAVLDTPTQISLYLKHPSPTAVISATGNMTGTGPYTVTLQESHFLTGSIQVTISGATGSPDVNGTHTGTVTGANTFTIATGSTSVDLSNAIVTLPASVLHGEVQVFEVGDCFGPLAVTNAVISKLVDTSYTKIVLTIERDMSNISNAVQDPVDRPTKFMGPYGYVKVNAFGTIYSFPICEDNEAYQGEIGYRAPVQPYREDWSAKQFALVQKEMHGSTVKAQITAISGATITVEARKTGSTVNWDEILETGVPHWPLPGARAIIQRDTAGVKDDTTTFTTTEWVWEGIIRSAQKTAGGALDETATVDITMTTNVATSSWGSGYTPQVGDYLVWKAQTGLGGALVFKA